MTDWTPELERLLEHEAEFEVKNKLIGINPRQPVLISLLRIAFRAAVEEYIKGGASYNKICGVMGLDSKGSYSENTQKMAELADANGRADTAKKLRQALYVAEEVARVYPVNDKESPVKIVMERMKAGKRGEIKFGPEACRMN